MPTLPLRTRLLTALVAILALPVVMGPGRCGFVLDYTETFLIPEPVQRIVLGADDGSVVATVYDREATLLKRHTFGFEPSLGVSEWSVDSGALTLEARCKYEDNCRFDHMFEAPLGVSFEITMKDSRVNLGYVDGDIELSLLTGKFRGVRLRSSHVAVALGAGEVSVDFAVAPETLSIELGEGAVEVTVPAGSYRCVLVTDAGRLSTSGLSCEDAASAILDIHVQTGDIVVKGA